MHASYVVIHRARTLKTHTHTHIGGSPSKGHHAHHLVPSGAASPTINEGYILQYMRSFGVLLVTSMRSLTSPREDVKVVAILTARAVRGTITNIG
jgi:hypothetical protein